MYYFGHVLTHPKWPSIVGQSRFTEQVSYNGLFVTQKEINIYFIPIWRVRSFSLQSCSHWTDLSCLLTTQYYNV